MTAHTLKRDSALELIPRGLFIFRTRDKVLAGGAEEQAEAASVVLVSTQLKPSALGFGHPELD